MSEEKNPERRWYQFAAQHPFASTCFAAASVALIAGLLCEHQTSVRRWLLESSGVLSGLGFGWLEDRLWVWAIVIGIIFAAGFLIRFFSLL
jgi:hypothetical protein